MFASNIANQFMHTPHGYFYNWLIDATGSWVSQIFGDTTHNDIVRHSIISIVANDMSWFALGIGLLIMGFMVGYRLIVANSEGNWGRGGSNVWYTMMATIALMSVYPIPSNQVFGKYSGGYYSLSQILVVHAILYASNAADYLWNASSKYLITIPRVRYNQQDVLTSATNTLRSLVCTYGVQSSSGQTPFMTVQDTKGNIHQYGQLNVNAFIDAAKIEWANGLCGTVVLSDEKDTSKDNEYAKVRAKFINTFYTRARPLIVEAYADLVTRLSTIANQIHNTSGLALAMVSPNSTSADNKNLQILNTLIKNFKDSITQYQTTLSNIPNRVNVSTIQNDLEQKMKQTGWASAGIYYLELANYQSAYNRLVSNFTESSAFRTPSICGESYTNQGCIEKQYLPDTIQGVNAVVSNSIPALAANNNLGATALAANLHHVCNAKGCDTTSVTRSIAVSLSQMFIKKSQWIGSFASVNQEDQGGMSDFNGSVNPIWALSSLGHALMTYAIGIWGFRTLLQTAEKTTENEDKAVNSSIVGFLGGGVIAAPIAAALSTILKETVTILGYIVTFLAAAGFLLGYVVVYWPVIIWMFMIIGYLVLVLEAIIAIPLGVIKLTVYEGSGVAGTNFQRLCALWFAVVCRPVLYVVAFDISLVLMYIGFGIVNTMYWKVASLNSSFGLFETLAALFIYVAISLAFIKIIFGYMHRLPEAVMYWLTGQMYTMFTDGGDPAAQMVEGAGRSGGAGVSGYLSTTRELSRQNNEGSRSNNR